MKTTISIRSKDIYEEIENGMLLLNLTYQELSFLRELLKKKQYELWQKKWLPQVKNLPDKQVEELAKMYFQDCKSFQGLLTNIRVQWGGSLSWMGLTDDMAIYKILKKINKIEDNIKKSLRRR